MDTGKKGLSSRSVEIVGKARGEVEAKGCRCEI